MASIEHLGVHCPTALDYLVSESILPDRPSRNSYKWKTYNDGLDFYGEEEVLTTDRCVVWSQNGVICRVFKYEAVEEKVSQALLTWFDDDNEGTAQAGSTTADFTHGLPKTSSTLTPGVTSSANHVSHTAINDDWHRQGHSRSRSRSRSRALVVLLQDQARIYHLHGSTHVVNLPFEVERVFPTPRGLLFQRKISVREAVPPTPMPPLVPFNTFIAPPPKYPSISKLQSQNESRKRSKISTIEPTLPRGLSDFVVDQSLSALDNNPRLFTLTDSGADMGLAVELKSHPYQSQHGEKAEVHMTIDDIDQDEEVIYVSSSDEFATSAMIDDTPFIILLTISRLKRTYSVWTASYVDSRRAAPTGLGSGKRHAPSPPKLRRSMGARKSMIANNPGVVNSRVRESFAGGVTGRASFTQFHPNGRPSGQTYSEPTPELDFAASIGAALDSPGAQRMPNRRTSSILARAELSSHDQASFTDIPRHPSNIGESFVGPNRRGPSFGVSNETTMRDRVAGRRATGDHRSQSLGSFANLRQSVGGDSMMDDIKPGSDDDFLDASLPEETFSRLQNEFIMRRLFTKALGDPFETNDLSTLPSPDNVEIFTIPSPVFSVDVNQQRRSLTVFIMNKALSTLSAIHLSIMSKPRSWQNQVVSGNGTASSSEPDQNAHTVHDVEYRAFRHIIDAVKVADGNARRLLHLFQAQDSTAMLSISPDWNAISPQRHQTISSHDYNFCGPVSLKLSNLQQGYVSKRTLPKMEFGPMTDAQMMIRFDGSNHAGLLGKFDVVECDKQRHQIRLQLLPKNQYVAKILKTCHLVLRNINRGDDVMLVAWWQICQKLQGENGNLEWNAMVVALFGLIVGCLSNGDSSLLLSLKSLEDLAQDSTQMHQLLSSEGSKAKSSKASDKVNGHVSSLEPTSPNLDETFKKLTDMCSNASFTPASDVTFSKYTIARCALMAKDLIRTDMDGSRTLFGDWLYSHSSHSRDLAGKLLIALNLLREEEKLDILSQEVVNPSMYGLAPVLAQMGTWLKWKSWSWESESIYSSEYTATQQWHYDTSDFTTMVVDIPLSEPPSMHQWLERSLDLNSFEDFPSMYSILREDMQVNNGHGLLTDTELKNVVENLTPRTIALIKFVRERIQPYLSTKTHSSEDFFHQYMDARTVETFPEAIVALLRNFTAGCQANPPTTLLKSTLKMIDREDLEKLQEYGMDSAVLRDDTISSCAGVSGKDARALATGESSQTPTILDETLGVDVITKLIYQHDNRFEEASTLLNSRLVALGVFIPTDGVSETLFLDEQKAFAQNLYKRTMTVPSGEALLGFSSHIPHSTQKIETPIFNTSCNIQPSNITVDVDKTPFGEDKAGWAYFHAGVAAGLYTARHGPNIETTWLTLNKPAELGIRHAGLLLALGLNGHLKKMAKWLAFKYLTPKHDMTTIGLLLGLAASCLGSMDTLITRLLSVHIPRLLPPGAAELNLSPLTQTAGIMGIGLLYCNSQHRRMSEVMISEIERADVDDLTSFSGAAHRDEGYRLAAGFALGMINLGRGKNLLALYDDSRLLERLLVVASAPQEINVVHVLDQATSGATIAVALIFMKTHDKLTANKIGVPDTLRQLDYARPDILLLRTVARNLILWDDIKPTNQWIWNNLPNAFRTKMSPNALVPLLHSNSKGHSQNNNPLSTEKLPYYNILAGLCWSISLKYAGSGSMEARDCLIDLYDSVTLILQVKSPKPTFDVKLTRNALLRFQHLLILSVATVMAGTGDLKTFRRLRVLHAIVNDDSTFGFHQAAHMAMGALFLGNGLFTFSTSNLAIASLLCAFYPIFPKDAMDNKAHLQAFRHLWTFAAEARCIIARDVETKEPIVTPILVYLRDGTNISVTAPQLLPELDTIARITTTSPEYWQVILDFERNPHHLASFRKHQTVFLRRKSLLLQYNTPFRIALATRRKEFMPFNPINPFELLFDLPIFGRNGIGHAEAQSIFPRGLDDDVREPGQLSAFPSRGRPPITALLDARTTGVDDMLVLGSGVDAEDRGRLVELRLLFKWAERERKEGRGLRWVTESGVEALRAAVLKRVRREGLERRRALEGNGAGMVTGG